MGLGGLIRLVGNTGAPSAAPVFAFKGADTTNIGASNWTSTTVDIGAATTGRYVILAGSDQNGHGAASITVNGVSLTKDAEELTARGGYIWSGLVGTAGGAGAATIVIIYNGNAAFEDRILMVWTGTGMAVTSGAVQTASASGTATISVTAGDFMIAASPSAINGSGSTESPTAVRTQVGAGAVFTQGCPEWNTVIATNAAFTLAGVGTSIAATYH